MVLAIVAGVKADNGDESHYACRWELIQWDREGGCWSLAVRPRVDRSPAQHPIRECIPELPREARMN